MKKIAAIVLAFVLAAALSGCATTAGTAAAAEEKIVTVTGSGGVEVVPDVVTITIGVETTGATAEAARTNSNQAINTTVEQVKALGVEDKDISTSGISLYPTYNNAGTVSGYRMSMDLKIVSRDLEQASKVIDVAIASGSNSLGRIQYSVSNEAEVYQQALTEAVKAAREKAQLLAQAEGKTIKEVQNITEEGSVAVVYKENPDTAFAAESLKNDTALMAGTSTITAQVTATFILE